MAKKIRVINVDVYAAAVCAGALVDGPWWKVAAAGLLAAIVVSALCEIKGRP